jgi:hypothetical protein
MVTRITTLFVSQHKKCSTETLSPPWTVEQIPGGYKVLDANGQSQAGTEALAKLLWNTSGRSHRELRTADVWFLCWKQKR